MTQYTTFFYRKKGLPAKTIGWMLKGIILLLLLYFIHQKVQLSFAELGYFGLSLFWGHAWYVWIVPFLLVFVNWGLEACKWQLLSARLSPLSYGQAVRAVLSGLSLGFVTPRSLGDYAGRMLESNVEQKERLVGAVLLNRISQSCPTYLFGIIGMIWLWNVNSFPQQEWLYGVSMLVIAGFLSSLLMLGVGRKWLVKVIQKMRGRVGEWTSRMFAVMASYSPKEISVLLGYAGLRYLIFSFQFICILWLAGLNLPFVSLSAGVAVVYLLKSVVPSFNFLSDLGVREVSALWVFAGSGLPENQLILASLLLWVLNLLIPSLIGTVCVFRYRRYPI